VVVGAGYIAVEMAGILQSLGSQVTLMIRHDRVLRNFDDTISEALTEEIRHLGINLMTHTNVNYIL
jgi:glutathione reductase (NADPH)